MKNTLEILSEIAHNVNKKIKTCNILDPHFKEPFTNFISYHRDKLQVRVFTSKDIFKVEIQGFESNFSFAVNLKEKVSLMNKILSKQIDDIPIIYIPQYQNKNQIMHWLTDSRNIQSIRLLNLGESEALFIYKNALIYYTPSGELDKKINVLFKIVERINKKNSVIAEEEIADLNFPEEFRELIPFITKWSISDDLLREEKIDSMTEQEKRELIDKVYPIIGEINNYISRFKNAIPDEAIILGNLAELVTELKLRKKGNTGNVLD